MDIIFLGGEVPSHRKILIESGVKHIGFNYWRAVKRGLPATKDLLLSEKFPDDVKVYVDGGGSQAKAAGMGPVEAEDYVADYQDFVALNDSNITMATELDLIDKDFLELQRQTFWEEFGQDKFLPVWHSGYPELMSLSERYKNIGLMGKTIDQDVTLAGRLRALNNTFHGIACANPSNLRQVPVSTASSLAWLSPMMRGETIVWNGTKLVRYQKKQKDQARPRYKGVIEQAGLDFDKIMDDDANEVTKLAIYSYLKLEEHLTRREGLRLLSDNSDPMDDPGYSETGVVNPDNRGSEMRKVMDLHIPETTQTLPVFTISTKRIIEKDDFGNDTIKDVPVMGSSSGSLRQCNTCFVASNCPAFKPDNACSFNLPVEVRTKDQLKGLLNAIIEMQGQRVAFARFSEELNGGYPDPNTGQEIDRLFKIVKQMKELEENKEFVRMTVERQTSGGVMSALFGDRANTLKQLPDGGLDEAQTTRLISDNLDK